MIGGSIYNFFLLSKGCFCTFVLVSISLFDVVSWRAAKLGHCSYSERQELSLGIVMLLSKSKERNNSRDLDSDMDINK